MSSQFQVKDAFLDPYGVPTFHVATEPPKEKFKFLLSQLAQQNLVALLRGSGDTLVVKVVQKRQLKPPKKRINLVLFAATIATVFYAGYFIWSQTAQDPLTQLVEPQANPYLKAGIFAVSLLAIIGLHEFGHKGAAMYHKMDATLPYFVPGPPPIGTFGALISLRAPPANRDQLFDLGLSGPIVGFAVTVAVGVASMVAGIALTPEQYRFGLANGSQADFSWPGTPLIVILSALLGASFVHAGSGVLLEGQLLFAANIGALLTYLNIVPAWQLDGGHVSRAVFGPQGHRIASFIGLSLLIVSGFWPFAILVLVMMSLSGRGLSGVEPLDDVSPLSISRKALYVSSLAMLVLTFAVTPFVL